MCSKKNDINEGQRQKEELHSKRLGKKKKQTFLNAYISKRMDNEKS